MEIEIPPKARDAHQTAPAIGSFIQNLRGPQKIEDCLIDVLLAKGQAPAENIAQIAIFATQLAPEDQAVRRGRGRYEVVLDIQEMPEKVSQRRFPSFFGEIKPLCESRCHRCTTGRTLSGFRLDRPLRPELELGSRVGRLKEGRWLHPIP